LEAFKYAQNLGWYDYKHFDSKNYIHYDMTSNGDLNWIVPNFLIACAGPVGDNISKQLTYQCTKLPWGLMSCCLSSTNVESTQSYG
jgi:hypothetical protein